MAYRHQIYQQRTIQDIHIRPRAHALRPSLTPVPKQPKPISVPRQKPHTYIDIKPALPRQKRSHVLQRQLVNQRTVSRAHKSHLSFRKYKKALQEQLFKPTLVVLVLFALVILGASPLQSFMGRRAAKVQSKVQEIATTPRYDGTIDETPISQAVLNNYQVSATQPRIIRIPKLQLYARVAHIPANNDSVHPPGNIYDSGWLDNTARPGEKGAMLISGHAFGMTKEGIFYRLGNLQPGEEITVENGSGKIFKYKVEKTLLIDNNKTDLTTLLSPAPAGDSSLILLSHNQRFDVAISKYGQRYAVYARLIN